ncbi:MAG: hypothetical protein WD928_16420 [Gammaproteobacteria bacterium]
MNDTRMFTDQRAIAAVSDPARVLTKSRVAASLSDSGQAMTEGAS